MDLEAELDGLYRAPLARFVATRNELAKRLLKAGSREEADRIQKLAKPSLTAWAVNQLAFQAREELAELLAAGGALRQAHLASASEQREAAQVRRGAVARLLEAVGKIFEDSGQPLGRAHRQRIARTLEALSSQGPDDEPRAGRLSRDLEPAGFDALAGLAAALGQAQSAKPRPTALAEVVPIASRRAARKSPPPAEPPAEPARVEEDRRREAERAAEDQQERERREAERLAAERLAAERLAAERREAAELSRVARPSLDRLESRSRSVTAAAEHADARLASARGKAAALAEEASSAERRARAARREADTASLGVKALEAEAEAAAATRQQVEQELTAARERVAELDARRRELEG